MTEQDGPILCGPDLRCVAPNELAPRDVFRDRRRFHRAECFMGLASAISVRGGNVGLPEAAWA